jgi:hypothetical protein
MIDHAGIDRAVPPEEYPVSSPMPPPFLQPGRHVMHRNRNSTRQLTILLGLAGLAVMVAFLAPAIPQDPAYHEFADRRTYLGVANFWNVVTNLPFLWVGLTGLRELRREAPGGIPPEQATGYRVFFAGIALVGPGSAYYHLAPDNATLLWDRLPMTIAFMAFFAVIVGEYISRPWGRKLLWPLVLAGTASVFYWQATERAGHGDLRPYALIQFLPMLLVPLILLMFRSSCNVTGYLWAVLAAYLAAKAAEFLDEPIFRVLDPLSGHAFKHLLAAFGAYCVLLAIRRRRAVVPE